MNMVTRGVRNAFRSPMRTASIVIIVGLTVALSLAMLIAHDAVGKRIDDVKASVGNTITISPAGVRGFDGGGNPLTVDQLSSVKALAHVSKVDETLNDRLTNSDTNLVSAIDLGALGQRFARRSGEFGGGFGGAGGSAPNFANFTPPVTVIGTTSPATLSNTAGGGTVSLKSGTLIDGTSSDKTALIGSTLATKNDMELGSTFTAYGQTITVTGIFDAGNSFSNNLVIMPLATVQSLSGQAGSITSATATVDSIANLSSVSTAIKSKLGDAADITTSTDRVDEIVTPLQNVQAISLYSLIGAVTAGAVILLMSMIMIVRERRREIGVLKAIGATNASVVGQFTSEAVTFTLLGAILGTISGILVANPITQILVTNSATSTSTSTPGAGRGFGGAARLGLRGVGQTVQHITTNIGWETILFGLGAALLIAVIGSAVAALFITKVKPAEVLRTE